MIKDLAAVIKVINNTKPIPEKEKQNTVRQIIDFISNKFPNERAASGRGVQRFSRRTIVPATEILWYYRQIWCVDGILLMILIVLLHKTIKY